MIDFHNHIIPAVDDGAKDLHEAKEMLLQAISQGVTDVIATPHIQNPRFENLNISDDDVKSAYNKLIDYIDELSLKIKIHLSAEVFFLPNLLKLLDHPFGTLGNSKYMLVEFHPSVIPLSFNEIAVKLQDAGVTPIIAHPERYIQIQNNFEEAIRLIKLGAVFQLDAGSIIGKYGDKAKKSAVNLLSSGLIQFLGSDAHNTSNRKFCLDQAVEKCTQYIGNDIGALIIDNPTRLLDGRELISLTKNKMWFRK